MMPWSCNAEPRGECTRSNAYVNTITGFERNTSLSRPDSWFNPTAPSVPGNGMIYPRFVLIRVAIRPFPPRSPTRREGSYARFATNAPYVAYGFVGCHHGCSDHFGDIPRSAFDQRRRSNLHRCSGKTPL